jgi:hypothetical protein
MENNEKVIFEENEISVTKSRYIVNDKTYVIRNISSVSVFKIIAHYSFTILWLLVGLLLTASETVRIYGIIIALSAIVVIFLKKNKYAVRITSNESKINSYISKDMAFVEKIVKALNEAVIQSK